MCFRIIFFSLPFRDFLHSNFVQYLRDATGNYDTSYPANQVSLSSNSFVRLDLKTSSKTCFFLCISQVHCYYHGEVEGYKNSLVAVSTCSGLRYKQLYFIWSQASFVLLLLITGSSFLVPPSVLGSLRFGPSFFAFFVVFPFPVFIYLLTIYSFVSYLVLFCFAYIVSLSVPTVVPHVFRSSLGFFPLFLSSLCVLSSKCVCSHCLFTFSLCYCKLECLWFGSCFILTVPHVACFMFCFAS